MLLSPAHKLLSISLAWAKSCSPWEAINTAIHAAKCFSTFAIKFSIYTPLLLFVLPSVANVDQSATNTNLNHGGIYADRYISVSSLYTLSKHSWPCNNLSYSVFFLIRLKIENGTTTRILNDSDLDSKSYSLQGRPLGNQAFV